MPIRHQSPFGAPLVASGAFVAASVATLAALLALAVDHEARAHGNVVDVDADGSRWVWNATSVLTSDGLFVQAAADAPAAGRWLRAPGVIDLALPIDYTLADAAILATLPAGARLFVTGGYWEVGTGFTGGSASAIGLSSSQTGHTTKGDLLGGASGNVTALLGTAGIKEATIGADIAAGVVLVPASTVRFDQVTSTFTAGVGVAHLVGVLLRNAGA